MAMTNDYICENYTEMFELMIKPMVIIQLLGGSQEDSDKAKKELLEIHWPKFYAKIEANLKSNSKFLLGNKLYSCDFMVGKLYTDIVANPAAYGRAEFTQLLKDYPLFAKFGQNFAAENARYLKSRPTRPL